MTGSLYQELVEKFKSVRCEHKLYSEKFCVDKFPHCKLDEFKMMKKCAVLVLLFRSKTKTNNELCILYTVRNFKLKSFPGEICYPGGNFDDRFDKTYEDTALREAWEEIGLKRKHVKVLCRLCPTITPFGAYIVPIIGIIDDANGFDSWDVLKDLKPNPSEVELIFWLPISYFHKAVNSTELFNQVISPIDYDKALVGNCDNNDKVPNVVIRNIFEINDEYFQNYISNIDNSRKVVPKINMLYGVNSHVALVVYLAYAENSYFECSIKGRITSSNVIDYTKYICLSTYFMYRNDKIKFKKPKSKI